MADSGASGVARRYGLALALASGIVAIVVAMLAGATSGLFTAIADPPPIVRAALAGTAIVVGGWLLRLALRRLEASMARGDDGTRRSIADADLGALVRGVRSVFLAAAAFTAAGAWILGHPLPLVVALVIAGVDVVETSFLLLVATSRRPRS